jgi:hypothetical protein
LSFSLPELSVFSVLDLRHFAHALQLRSVQLWWIPVLKRTW